MEKYNAATFLNDAPFRTTGVVTYRIGYSVYGVGHLRLVAESNAFKHSTTDNDPLHSTRAAG